MNTKIVIRSVLIDRQMDAVVGNIGSTGNLARKVGTQDHQRRGSMPITSISGHKKLCRVVKGERVVLGNTQPVFVTQLRPAISTELLILAASRTPTKSRSPLRLEMSAAPIMIANGSPESTKWQDSDQSVTISNSDTSDGAESPKDHTLTNLETSQNGPFDFGLEQFSESSQNGTIDFALEFPKSSENGTNGFGLDSNSPQNRNCDIGLDWNSSSNGNFNFGKDSNSSMKENFDFGLDFSKLSLQDSGYSGSLPLCSTNSDAASINSPRTSTNSVSTPALDTINSQHYPTLLDFTFKLGYNETQLRSVLNKLGTSNPGQDKVLAELIKLGQDVQDATDAGTRRVEMSSIGGGLRSIVIDGSNVAMTHGNKVVFSCLGIRLCVDWFRQRGHTHIKVFVPQFRKEHARSDNPVTDQRILFDLEKENVLVWTPSRRLGGRRIICHDDRYILKTAMEKDAVIVSNDEYRDMMYENPEFRKTVEERLLMYNFIDGKFIVPDDPLGRYGPKLEQFLNKSGSISSSPPCPYGRKCTYGSKCKFYHPERAGGLHRSVTERLKDHAALHRRIAPTHSLQSERITAIESIGNGGIQKQEAFRTRSLNPASLAHQRNHINRYSPPSYRCNIYGNATVERVQMDSVHSSLSKQFSNPEVVRMQYGKNGRYSRQAPNQIWHGQHGGVPAGHQPIGRNMSTPWVQRQVSYVPPVSNYLLAPNEDQRKNSVSDSHLNTLGVGGGVSAQEDDDAFYGSNYYIPSTTVWGPVEHSSSPVFTSPTGWLHTSASTPVFTVNDEHSPSPPCNRSNMKYHLAQLFPEHLVNSVMMTNPNETDPQKLCKLILAARNGEDDGKGL